MYRKASHWTVSAVLLAAGCAGPGPGAGPGVAGTFFEADDALARTARLRAGGTLGES